MKKLKIYEEFKDFTGYIELSYYVYDSEIIVDVYSNGEIVDIYTYRKNPFSEFKWIPGDNKLFVHCSREDYPDMVEFLLDGDDVHREVVLYNEEEDDMDEDFYNELEQRMKNRYEAEAEQMRDVKKYNV